MCVASLYHSHNTPGNKKYPNFLSLFSLVYVKMFAGGRIYIFADIIIKIVSRSATLYLILFNYLHGYYLDFLYLGWPSADFLLMVSWPRGLRPSCHTTSNRIVVQIE
jgi:hypothetical protein